MAYQTITANEVKYNVTSISSRTYEFIYGCAMHDAILQQAFTGDKTWVGEVAPPKAILKCYVDQVLNGRFSSPSEKSAHDKTFLETANAICEAINNSPKKPSKPNKNGVYPDTFSFGNAQKLINMTIKHLYTLTYHDANLRDCFMNCHCPMDSIMLKKVYDAYGDAFGKNKKLNYLTTKFTESWGDEGVDENNIQGTLLTLPDRYDKFQTAITDIIAHYGGDIFPIEFDYIFW